MPRVAAPVASRELLVEAVLPERPLDLARFLQLGDDAVAFRIHVRTDVVRHLPGRVAEADPLIEGRQPEPHGPLLHQLVPAPEPYVMPLARAVADRLLEGQVLLASEQVERADWCLVVRPPQDGIDGDAH